MYSIGERIKQRRKELDLTVRELAQRIGVSHATLSKWERGETRTVKASMIQTLSRALDCEPLWLIGLKDDPLMIPNIEPLPEMEPVPIIGEIACGDPITAEENWEGLADAPVEMGADFALRAKGDSMINARIFPGDLVFIRQQSDVDNGEIAAILIDGEATLKRLYKFDDRVELRPENPLYETLRFEGRQMEDLRILGKALIFVSKVR